MTNSAGPEFVLSGYRLSASMSYQDTLVYYWTNTAYSSYYTQAYALGLYSSGGVDLASGYGKYYGFSLRCLAPPTPSTNYSLTPLDQTLC